MAKETLRWDDRIVEDPEIMVGKPVIKGTRIPVELVLGHLAANPNLDELFAAYPRLTVEDVKTVLAYAHEAMAIQHKRTSHPVATEVASMRA
ncbi:MAG: DUF433 domain-containing protein [Chloroflexota bacterium]|nr:DUF433 domain-containing protein [Chloroflexota bacterium]